MTPQLGAAMPIFTLSLLGFLCVGIFSVPRLVAQQTEVSLWRWASASGPWGTCWANGDDRTTLLFAGLTGFAVLHAVLKSRSGPFVPSVEREGHNLLSLMAGLALYGLAAQLHVVIAGVPLVTLQ